MFWTSGVHALTFSHIILFKLYHVLESRNDSHQCIVYTEYIL